MSRVSELLSNLGQGFRIFTNGPNWSPSWIFCWYAVGHLLYHVGHPFTLHAVQPPLQDWLNSAPCSMAGSVRGYTAQG